MINLEVTADRLTAQLQDVLDEHDVPGASVGICDASGQIWSQSFGRTRRQGGAPVSATTMFSVQSVSKMYTATVIMTAVRDGLLDLDAPITEYLPDFTVHSVWEAEPERKITIRRLLGHKAGFTHEAPIGSNYRSSRSWAAHVSSISDTWLRFPVGHHHEYSNLGIDLAAHALERVAGRPFHAYARDQLFRPLGLERTTFNQRIIAAEPDRAVGHDPTIARLPVWIPIIPSGGLYAGVEDVCRFIQFHLRDGEDLLSRDLLAEMSVVPEPEPEQDLGYGLGLAQLRIAGRPVRGHGGGGFGFSCNVLWSAEASPGSGRRSASGLGSGGRSASGLGVVILTNTVAYTPTMRIPEMIFTEFLGQVDTPVAPERGLQRFAGSFVGRFGPVDGDDLPYDGPQVRYRQDGDYLIRNDGITFYRNEVPELPGGAEPDGPWNRDYKITVAGSAVARVRLHRDGDTAAVERVDDGTRLALRRHRDDLYVSSNGEMLDLSNGAVSYANIPLTPS